MRSDRVQFNMLQLQDAGNVWRKNALAALLESGSQLLELDENASLKKAANIFNEEIDFSLKVLFKLT